MDNIDFIIFILIGVVGIVLGGLLNQIITNAMGKSLQSKSESRQKPLLSIFRDPETDQILVSVSGEDARVYDQLNKEDQKKTKDLMSEMNKNLGYVNHSQSEETKTGDKREEPETEEKEATVSKPSFNPVTVFVRALQAEVKKSELPSESIVSQINDILQADLKNSPQIKDPVRLMEWPGMGMVVMVGLDKYNHVDEVPDEAIREIIHSAVKKWEMQGSQEK